MQQGGAAVNALRYEAVDFLIPSADNLHLYSGISRHKDLVKHHGVYDNQYDTVENGMGISLNQLKPQNHTVHDIQSHGHIHIQLFLKHQGRNVHAPCGGSCPHHYADPPAYEQPRIEHCHQLLFQHKAAKSASLHHTQQNRVDNGAEYGCQGKLFTQHPCPQQKHGHVKHADKKADGDAKAMVHKQGQSRGSSCNETVRHNEQHHCCRVHHISHQNFSQTEYNLSRRFFLFHDFSPFSLHRNEFPN